MSFYIREENRFALGVLKNYLYEYKVELQTHQSPHKFTQNLAYFTSHEANNFAWQSYLARKSFHSNNFKDTQRVEKKKYPIKITWLNSHKLISSFCYSSKGQECVWLKAVSHEVMSFQSVSKWSEWDVLFPTCHSKLCAVLCSHRARWCPAQSRWPRKDALISFWKRVWQPPTQPTPPHPTGPTNCYDAGAHLEII